MYKASYTSLYVRHLCAAGNRSLNLSCDVILVPVINSIVISETNRLEPQPGSHVHSFFRSTEPVSCLYVLEFFLS